MLFVRPRRWIQFELFSFRQHGIFYKVFSGRKRACQRVLYIYSRPTSEPSPLQKTAFPLVKMSRLALGPPGGFDVRSSPCQNGLKHKKSLFDCEQTH